MNSTNLGRKLIFFLTLDAILQQTLPLIRRGLLFLLHFAFHLVSARAVPWVKDEVERAFGHIL